MVEKLKAQGIMAYICYVPLHSAPMGRKLGWRPEDCPITEDYGARTLRLPLYADMTAGEAEVIAKNIEALLHN